MLHFDFPFIQLGRVIHSTPDDLWDLLTDTNRWLSWGPSIAAVECEHKYIRAGSRGRIKTIFGFWAPFVVTDWTHRRYWSWRVFNIRATGHRIETIDAGCCRLVFEVPFWAAPYVIICKMAAARIARSLEKGA